MLVALLWLMLGAPVIHIEQQKHLTKITSQQNTTDESDQNSFPFDGEENTELNPGAFTFEYLQAYPTDLIYMNDYLKHNSFYSCGLLILKAELFSPPPESLS